MRAAMRLRDALVPYIYTRGFEAWQSGVSIIQPMYYHWPAEDNAYLYQRSQYLFGSANILVAPITTAGVEGNGSAAAGNGTARKDIWLPALEANARSSGGPSWLLWDGTPVPAAAGSVLSAEWGVGEVPVFVRPGTIVPMRTMASTHSSFSDPLVWAIWPSAAGASSTSFSLFEDSGDGLQYQLLDRSAFATTGVTLNTTLLPTGPISLVILPTVGAYAGQGVSRAHLVRLHCRVSQMAGVSVNGNLVGPISPGSGDAPGWYYSPPVDDGRDDFTAPPGLVTVATGRHSIRSTVVVELDVRMA
jgi:hypothetical protein